MPTKKPRGANVTSLIWEYLDGGITPKRAERLSGILAERADAREQLLESAALHGMLFEFSRVNVRHATSAGASEVARRRHDPVAVQLRCGSRSRSGSLALQREG